MAKSAIVFVIIAIRVNNNSNNSDDNSSNNNSSKSSKSNSSTAKETKAAGGMILRSSAGSWGSRSCLFTVFRKSCFFTAFTINACSRCSETLASSRGPQLPDHLCCFLMQGRSLSDTLPVDVKERGRMSLVVPKPGICTIRSVIVQG